MSRIPISDWKIDINKLVKMCDAFEVRSWIVIKLSYELLNQAN